MNRKEIRFLLLFALIFMFLQLANYASRSYTDRFLVETLHTRTSSILINIITPAEKTYVQAKIIRSGDFGIKIDTGCDGVEGFILLVAAMLAFPVRTGQKALGIASGLAIIYIFNLTRIIFLYYISKYDKSLFDFIHVYVGQTFMVILGLLIFIVWAFKCTTHEKKMA